MNLVEVVFVSFIFSLMKKEGVAEIPMKAPFGPRMCEDYCAHFSQCSTFCYDPSTLSCQAEPVDESDESGNKLVKTMTERTVNCSTASRIIQNKGDRICVPVVEPIKGRVRERLLILMSDGVENKQMIEEDGDDQIMPYPFIQKMQIIQVGFVKSERELVLFTKECDLKFLPIDSKEISLTKIIPCTICAMAVDSLSGFIFLASKKSSVYKGSKETEMKFIRSEYHLQCTIGVDWFRKRVFLVYGNGEYFMTIDYEGENSTPYNKMKISRLLAFNDGWMYMLSKFGMIAVNDTSNTAIVQISKIQNHAGLRIEMLQDMAFFRGHQYFVFDGIMYRGTKAGRDSVSLKTVFVSMNDIHIVSVW